MTHTDHGTQSTHDAVVHGEFGAGAVSTANPFHRFENILVSVALLAMVLIPVTETILRYTAGVGISGSTSLVQHLTLIVSMIGAAIAAREGRLLSLATTAFLKGRMLAAARIFSASFGAAVSFYLGFASYQFVLSEREAGKILAYGIPIWVVQSILPIGFIAIALRLLGRSSDRWPGRLIALALTIAFVIFAAFVPLEPSAVVPFAMVILLAAAIFGAPIFVILGGAALILFWGEEVPIAAVTVNHYALTVNAAIPAIPLFTLAGYLLAEGGASRRLVRVFDELVGWFRGGPAIVTALTCAFFTTFTGGSGVTILALGGLLMPVLRNARYSERDSLGLLTGAGSLGLLFPPCLPLILYSIVASVQMEQMFLGGILPGVLLVALTIWWGIRQGPRDAEEKRFSAVNARKAVWEAKWELLLPVVVLALLFSGFATPVEASALTALYALIVETLVYRDYKSVKSVSAVFAECGLLVGGVMLIFGIALGFTSYLVDVEMPARLVEWVTGAVESRLLFLLLLNLFLLAVGCLMEIYVAIIVVVPLIVPLGEAFGIDPIHLGIIFLANLELGYLSPPVGINLLLSSYRFRKPIGVVYRAVIPMLLVLLVGVLVITYFPPLTTFLPRLFAP